MINDESSNESGTSSPTILLEGIGKKPAIRYVEARRIGTCAFADRIATLSIQHYKEHINATIRTKVLPQTCIATIVAAFHITNLPSTSLQGQQHHQQQQQQQQEEQEINTPPIIDLKVLAMGVGTKFLSEQILKSEREINHDETDISVTGTSSTIFPKQYGTRIRDCHAEVLCRRAFRKYLLDCIEQMEFELRSKSPTSSNDSRHDILILERCMVPNHNQISSSTGRNIENQSQILYQLRPDVTLHMYCSSTPCGNSTIKKFATLQKEIYCSTLPNDTWPSNRHNHLNSPVVGHSIPIGQFALLVKKDNHTTSATTTTSTRHVRVLSKKEGMWSIYNTTDWCPPGTTTVWSNQGSVHTCSDKIARWNYLGYQGSLLSTYLKTPIYIATITVGRKFSSMTCRRAICCRLDAHNKISTNSKSKKRAKIDNLCDETIDLATNSEETNEFPPIYQLHHPTVMGTSVYMDETGFIDMSAISQIESTYSNTTDDCEKDDNGSGRCTISTSPLPISNSSGEIRFVSPMSFVTWLRHPSLSSNRKMKDTDYEMECIDGSTGFLMDDTTSDYDENGKRKSKVCSFELMNHFFRLKSMKPGSTTSEEQIMMQAQTLSEYRKVKRIVAGPYEDVKNNLLSKHPVLRDWKRHMSNNVSKG